LLSRYGRRLSTKELDRLTSPIEAQLPEAGCRPPWRPCGQRLSGNVSVREIFRYTKPIDQEVSQMLEELW
jgi:hypothetical protein